MIEAVADGYETEKVLHRFNPPWYQIPPIDFFAETLWPWELRDEQTVDIAMRPKQLPDRDQLVARGQVLRNQSAQGVATPMVVPAGGNSNVGLTENQSFGITNPVGVAPNPYGGPTMGVTNGAGPGFAAPANQQQSGAGGWMSQSVPPVRDYRPAIGGN